MEESSDISFFEAGPGLWGVRGKAQGNEQGLPEAPDSIFDHLCTECKIRGSVCCVGRTRKGVEKIYIYVGTITTFSTLVSVLSCAGENLEWGS